MRLTKQEKDLFEQQTIIGIQKFKNGTKSYFKIQNVQQNPTRIFLRQIKCYREYIDFRLMELKYKACDVNTNDKWYNYCGFYPLIFCYYGEILNPNFVNCDGTRTCFTFPNIQNCGLYIICMKRELKM